MRRRILAVWLAVAVAGVLGMALPGNAFLSDSVPDAAIGYVDLARVTAKVRRHSKWRARLKASEEDRRRAQRKLEELAKGYILPPAERAEWKQLHAKPHRTRRDRDRLETLQARSDTLCAELDWLSKAAYLTEAETRRKSELVAMRWVEEGKRSGPGKRRKAVGARPRKSGPSESEILDRMQADILEAVAKVTEREGLAMMLDRQGVLAGGRDFTGEVLKELR